MLGETQGVEVDLATLEAIGKRDLERNLAAMKKAARRLDPQAAGRRGGRGGQRR